MALAKPGQEEREKRCIFIVPSDITAQERNLLTSVAAHLKHVYRYEVDEKTVGDNQKEVEKLGKIEEYLNKYGKIVLAFPGGKIRGGEERDSLEKLRKLIKTILQHTQGQEIRRKSYVYTIMYSKDYDALPSELQDFNIRRFLLSPDHMRRSEDIAFETTSFLEAEPDDLNLSLSFLNFGVGLAWSLYMGYLSHILPAVIGEKTLQFKKKDWYKGEGDTKDISNAIILNRMLIYPRTEKKNESKRLIFHKFEVKANVAGIDRRYEADVREVKAPQGDERYFGVADFANCLHLLIDIRDDKTMSGGETENSEFFKMAEDDMNKQGRYFYERLKLILNKRSLDHLNREIRLKRSLEGESSTYTGVNERMFKMMPYSGTVRPASADDQVNDLFEKMKSACQEGATSVECESDLGASAEKTGVLLTRVEDVHPDVSRFVQKLNTPYTDYERANVWVGQSKNIFMVLTDELVQSDGFEERFYNILHHGYRRNNRRFLVCLDCLTTTPTNQPALGLLLLFKRISYEEGWEDLVKTELEGDPQEIGYNLLMRNVGTGLALSYYYRFLKIRFPDMKTIVSRTPGLEDMVKEGLMSYKLFILLPSSCRTKGKLSQADSRIKNKEEDDDVKKYKLPFIGSGRRNYTPQLHSIEDEEGEKKYLAFVEYNTQCNTLLQMKDTGVMDEDVFAQESEDFINKLRAIRDHRNEPEGLKHWLCFIKYDDDKKDFCLADKILENVRREIDKENGRPPVE